MDTRTRSQLVNDLIAGGLLLGADDIETLKQQGGIPDLAKIPPEIAVIGSNTLRLLNQNCIVDWMQLERLRAHYDKGRSKGYTDYMAYFENDSNNPKNDNLVPDLSKSSGEIPLSGHTPKQSQNSNPDTAESKLIKPSVNILFNYDQPSHKYGVGDFVQYFNKRYQLIERLLRGRQELQGAISISRVLKKQSKENVSIVGMVLEKAETKNNNIMLTVEDPTGQIKVVISKNKPDLFSEARDIVHDEVIGITGVCGERIIFANNVFWPDIPYNNEVTRAKDEVYAVFLSDIHVGSKYYLSNEFDRFIRWINGQMGTPENRDIANKVGYIIIAGDIVDGVGIYPEQEKELVITDIYEQYNEVARLLSQIPKHIKIIISPGNHDALRLSEPQPPLDKDFAASLYRMPNVTIVSNPALVALHNNENFDGIKVLIYHGYSFDYHVANVDSIRNADKTSDPNQKKSGYHYADLIMKFLLRRRHLGPSHASTLHVPDLNTDPLVIMQVPDIFVTGHIHYSLVANYRNVTMISGSCWQGTTSFQEKMGHKPEPARVPVINLKTRKPKILKFD